VNVKTEFLFLIPTDLEFRSILSAFEEEYGPLILEGGVIKDPQKRFAFRRCGIGKKSIQRLVRSLSEDELPEVFISTGCAGSVLRQLSRTVMLLPERVVNNHLIEVDLEQERLFEIPDVIAGGTLLSLRKPADRKEKQKIRENDSTIWAVDMESYWIAQEAQAVGAAACVLRVTADSADDRIPDWGLRKQTSFSRAIGFFPGFLYKYRAKKACYRLGRVLGIWLKRKSK